jgi:hypothetical protein
MIVSDCRLTGACHCASLPSEMPVAHPRLLWRVIWTGSQMIARA